MSDINEQSRQLTEYINRQIEDGLRQKLIALEKDPDAIENSIIDLQFELRVTKEKCRNLEETIDSIRELLGE